MWILFSPLLAVSSIQRWNSFCALWSVTTCPFPRSFVSMFSASLTIFFRESSVSPSSSRIRMVCFSAMTILSCVGNSVTTLTEECALAREKRSWFWRFVAHRPRCFALLLFHAHVDHVGTRLPQERPRVLAVEFVADRRDRNRFVGR